MESTVGIRRWLFWRPDTGADGLDDEIVAELMVILAEKPKMVRRRSSSVARRQKYRAKG
jgi:hypothetical protein